MYSCERRLRHEITGTREFHDNSESLRRTVRSKTVCCLFGEQEKHKINDVDRENGGTGNVMTSSGLHETNGIAFEVRCLCEFRKSVIVRLLVSKRVRF